MPELPEVETIRRGLQSRLPGDTITALDIRWPKSFQGDVERINNQPITAVRRVAKVLVIDLANNYSILVHFKMTGQLIYVHGQDQAVGGHPEKAYQQPLPHKHTHLIYSLKSGAKLYYNDLRKFGWHKVVPTAEVEAALGRQLAGTDILSDRFTVDALAAIMEARPRRSIKEAIMEQGLLAGLGNIYAAEALWWAKIRPDRPAGSLTKAELAALFGAIRQVIDLSLEYGGSSFNSYVDAAGRQGAFLQYAEVYQKSHDSLGHSISRIKQGGRTTHFCPICQH